MEGFENLNNYQNLEFLVGSSPEELKDQILQIKTPIEIIAIYAVGARHVAWLRTHDKIVKKKKGAK